MRIGRRWHLGHYRPSLLPTSRGFASYFGFLSGCEDHRTQENCCACPNRAVVDLFRNGLPARGENGTDNTEAFTREACEVVRRYASRYDERAQTRRPLFLYLALQDVHAPFQVNPRFEALHQSPLRHFNVWAGMVSAVDETVHNVTQEASPLPAGLRVLVQSEHLRPQCCYSSRGRRCGRARSSCS